MLSTSPSQYSLAYLIMRTSRILPGFFNASVLCLLWLTKHVVDSARISSPDVVKGVYGGSVSIPCQYEQRFRDYTKYWCKGPVYELCRIQVKTPRNRPANRTSIVDDKEAGVFTVTMTSLNDSDEGTYWCVIARHGKNTYKGVRLQLSHPEITTPTTHTPQITHEEISVWMTLRWILFFLILFCVMATHVIIWRIRTTEKTQLHQRLQRDNSNVYE